MAAAQSIVENLLRGADIRIDGDRPWDIRVHDARFFPRVLTGGTLGFGESYMGGWWDCAALDEMCCPAVAARLDQTLMAWEENFRAAWPQFEHRFGERFRRMWRCYLLSCAGAFRARTLQAYSILLLMPATIVPASSAAPSGENGMLSRRSGGVSSAAVCAPRNV